MKTVFIIFDVKIESQGFNRRGPSRPIKVMNSCCGNSKEVQSLTKKIFLSAYVITIHFTDMTLILNKKCCLYSAG